MLFLGNPVGEDTVPSHWMKMVRLSIRKGQLVVIDKKGEVEKTWDKADWSEFPRVQDIFKGVVDQWEGQTIEKTKVVLRMLTELDEFYDDEF